MDSEQSMRLLLIGAVTVIVAVALGFIAFGYWYSVVKPRNRTVLEVEGTKISYVAIKRRMAYELFQNINYQQAPANLAEGTYATLLNELTVIARAQSDGNVTYTQEELDSKLRTRVGVGDSADQKAFADALRRQLDITGLTESEYRRLILAELLTQKLKDNLKAQLPATAIQAKVEVIATNAEADATAAIARLNAGEDWATVAKETSAEVDVQTTGGLHDYAPQGTFNPAYDDYVFTAPIGEISAPISSPSGQFFVVRVDDRADKPVTEDQKPQMTAKAYSDWLMAQQDQLSMKRDFDMQSAQDAMISVVNEVAPRLQQQQQRQQQQAQPIQPQQQEQPPVDQQPPPASGDQPAPVAPAPGGGNGQ